jgi:hypothetical protein
LATSAIKQASESENGQRKPLAVESDLDCVAFEVCLPPGGYSSALSGGKPFHRVEKGHAAI